MTGIMTTTSHHSSAPIVALRGVGKTFPSGTVALAGLDLDVREGEFLSLLGPSGCGKSTALRIIAGLTEPTQGAVEWTAAAKTENENRLGFVFQEPTLMPWANVANNVLLPLKLKGVASEEASKRVAAALDRVAAAAQAQGRRRRRSARRASQPRSSASACRNSRTPIRANCPAACACGSRSRARWSPSRSCC